MRLKTFIRGSLVALACIAPALADDAPAFSMTAIAAALREGRGQDAETLATQMLSSGGALPIDNAYLLLNRGLAREQLGKRQGAVRDFTAAIDSKALSKGELARALFDRGVALDELGRTDDAIADYSQALAIVPRYATALNNRGNAYRRTGRYALARADYQSALAAGDDEPEYPLYGLGRVAEALNDKSMAKSYYRKALAANGQFPPATQRMALLGDVPADGSYALRTPESDEARASAEPKVADPVKPKPETHTAREAQSPPADESFGLRPAILEGGRKAKPRQKPIRLASIAPPELSERSAAAAPVSAPSDEARPSNDGEMVQLGAFHNQSDATLGWDHMVAGAGDLLNGASPRIMEADVPGKGHYWRLRTQAPSGTTAAAFCSQLKAKGLSCIAAKS